MHDSPVIQGVTGKVALITCAASGIGHATAELFAERGARVLALEMAPQGIRVNGSAAATR